MKEISKPKIKQYWVVYNDKDVSHFGFTEPSQVTQTGLPYMLQANTLKELIAKTGAISARVLANVINQMNGTQGKIDVAQFVPVH